MELWERYRELKKHIDVSSWKPRPELSEAAKSVRKRIFYFSPIVFLVLLNKPPEVADTPLENISFLGFDVNYESALSCIVLMLLYLFFHFLYEIVRDFKDNRMNWKGSTKGLDSVTNYISENAKIASEISSIMRSIISSGDFLTDSQQSEEQILEDFREEYRNLCSNWNNQLSLYKDSASRVRPSQLEEEKTTFLKSMESMLARYEDSLEDRFNMRIQHIDNFYIHSKNNIDILERRTNELTIKSKSYFFTQIIITF